MHHVSFVVNKLSLSAIITSATKFGSLLVCRAPVAIVQQQVELDTNQVTNTYTTFHAYLTTQPHHVKHLLGTLLDNNIDTDYWIKALNDNKVTIATDGSVADKKGYFAVVLHMDKALLRFQSPCDCHSSLVSLYCTEMAGILSALYLLCALATFTNTPITTSQVLVCDNMAAVQQSNASALPGLKAHMATDFDVINEIMASKDDAFELKVSWVKAHLDEKTPINELMLEEQLNVKADADVNSFRANTPSHLEPSPTPTVFPSTSAWITIDG
eukprot:15335827-Ditylum_brightwellii.AAC.1